VQRGSGGPLRGCGLTCRRMHRRAWSMRSACGVPRGWDDPTISWGFVLCEVVWGAHEWVLVHDHLSSNRGIVVSDERSHLHAAAHA
jgi:hypothetical protein